MEWAEEVEHGGKGLTQQAEFCCLIDMDYKNIKEARAMEEVISLSLVDQMFAVVAGEFSEGEQNGQKKWNTVVLHSRRNVAV